MSGQIIDDSSATVGLSAADSKLLSKKIESESAVWWDFMPDWVWMVAAGVSSFALFSAFKSDD